jgi:hypothetical protein
MVSVRGLEFEVRADGSVFVRKLLNAGRRGQVLFDDVWTEEEFHAFGEALSDELSELESIKRRLSSENAAVQPAALDTLNDLRQKIDTHERAVIAAEEADAAARAAADGPIDPPVDVQPTSNATSNVVQVEFGTQAPPSAPAPAGPAVSDVIVPPAPPTPAAAVPAAGDANTTATVEVVVPPDPGNGAKVVVSPAQADAIIAQAGTLPPWIIVGGGVTET